MLDAGLSVGWWLTLFFGGRHAAGRRRWLPALPAGDCWRWCGGDLRRTLRQPAAARFCAGEQQLASATALGGCCLVSGRRSPPALMAGSSCCSVWIRVWHQCWRLASAAQLQSGAAGQGIGGRRRLWRWAAAFFFWVLLIGAGVGFAVSVGGGRPLVGGEVVFGNGVGGEQPSLDGGMALFGVGRALAAGFDGGLLVALAEEWLSPLDWAPGDCWCWQERGAPSWRGRWTAAGYFCGRPLLGDEMGLFAGVVGGGRLLA